MKLSTESYKGVRDFYPEDQFIENYIFAVWRKTVESFGYVEYGASILEPSELYSAKTGEEIVTEQTYNFKDRSERNVTLRPEMTPTVARMVAARIKQLPFPLRWYSIPNLFRYEQPQKGRLREHWQLNADLFGVAGIEAEVEMISMLSTLMRNFGAREKDYQIRINSRAIMNELFARYKLDADTTQKLSKVIDKKDKIMPAVFEESVTALLKGNAKEFMVAISSGRKLTALLGETSTSVKELISLIEKLNAMGILNISFEPTLMRGFDYYTGIVFEIFDTNSENRRSIAGGGRFDELLKIFDVDKVPTIGFGMGDVTIRDFLETHKLLPEYASTTWISICVIDSKLTTEAMKLAQTLREGGVAVSVDVSGKKLGDQIKLADKQKIPFILPFGEDEMTSGIYNVKKLDSGDEKKLTTEQIIQEFK
ncbi:histidine--tRNA ligase [Candidatus Parcubacteria bacterium]|nr:histidine--tRNA ligase [Candidatus Parcubacteria bacterium]